MHREGLLPVTAHKLLKANAEIAFGTIVNTACLNERRPDTVLPENAHGVMCNTTDPKIAEKVFEIMRTRNFAKCTENAFFLSSRDHEKKLECKSSITRYFQK